MSTKTKTETGSSHITPVGGNVFLDIGFEPEEAARLLAESRVIITKKIASKAAKLAKKSAKQKKP